MNGENEPIGGDGVVQALMDILQSPAVTAAKSVGEAAGQILSAALDASASNQDAEVRAWFMTWLSSYLPDKNGTSIFGEIVRAAFRQKVDFLMDAGPQADRIPPDLAVAQRAVYLSALRQLEGAKWSTGPSVIGPDLGHFQSLLTQKRAVEPIGENVFERLPVEVSFYGDMLTNQDQYQAAVEVWRRVVEVYPNTHYARYCQDKIDNLCQVGLAKLQ
jgi:hypothetical protein